MAKNFTKAERYLKENGEYKLLSIATSSESVEMTDGTDLQTKMDLVDKSISDEVSRATEAENALSENKLDKTTVASSSTLGLVKSGTDITVDTSGNVSVNDNSHKHTVSNISDLTATASELNVLDGITATTQELNYVDGVKSNIQTQLDSKSSNDHTHDDRYYTESEIDTTVSDINNSISFHTSNTSNPHSVTKAQVGLGNVENKSSATIRGEITKSNVTTALGYTPLNQSLKGSASGLAELDSNGKVPSSQLPSFVDDVVEGYLSGGKFYKESAHTTEISGETGKIYIDLSTEKTYRWSGSAFVVISETLALGETSSTAYRGDRGKTAYDHSQSTHARTDATKVEASSTNGNIKINGTETTVYTHPSGTNPHGTTKSDVGLGNVDNTKDIDKPISTKQQEKFDELNSNLSTHTHKYAGSSSVGGSANSAVKLESSAGSATQPVYFSEGKPVACTYTLGKSVPSDAVFTDTWRGIQNNLTSDSTTDSLSAAQGKVLKGLVDGKAASSHTHSSYVNQNAFSNITVGSTTVSADSTTDTLTLVAGSNVTITPDATNDKITIASSHPTISKSTDSTSTASPSAGGTFTAIDSVTRDSNGHVTKVNTKTITLPNTAVTVDTALSSTSTNPVQNKVINSAINGISSALGQKMNRENAVGTGNFSINRKSGSAVGNYSSTLGYNCTAEGPNSHAEGYETYTVCSGCHAEGEGTYASTYNQHVQGKYNIKDGDGVYGQYAHIVGNGTSDSARSNAHTLDWTGNAWFAGDVTNGNGVSLNSLNSALNNKANSDHTHNFTVIDLSNIIEFNNATVHQCICFKIPIFGKENTYLCFFNFLFTATNSTVSISSLPKSGSESRTYSFPCIPLGSTGLKTEAMQLLSSSTTIGRNNLNINTIYGVSGTYLCF